MKHLFVASTALFLLACAEEPAATAYDDSETRMNPSGSLTAFFDCVEDAGVTLISAHRGGPTDGFPENAVPTFENTMKRPGMLLEVDVATSSDGVLFLHHDRTLGRTTTGRGVAAETPWEQLRSLSLKDPAGNITPFGLTRFDDALRWSADRAILQLDIKRSTDYDDVAAWVKAENAEDRVILIAYTPGQAFALASRFPNSVLSVPFDSPDDLSDYLERGLDPTRLIAWTGTEGTRDNLYTQLESQNIEIAYGTLGGQYSIDDEVAEGGSGAVYAELAKQGVDILATDNPRTAYEMLAKKGLAYQPGQCQ